jgi:hypothetical protein
VNALADPEVGDYLNKHFVASFQKVGTFRVTGNQKQGGNVAAYFCTPGGGVLDAIAGPVDASTFLRAARWVVETRKMALLEAGGAVNRYRLFFRMAHAQRLADEDGVTDINWPAVPLYTPSAAALAALLDQDRHMASLNPEGKVQLLLAAFPLVKLDQAYRAVYEKVLGEKVTTAPVVEGNAPAPSSAEGSAWLTPPAAGRPAAPADGGLDPDRTGAGAGARSPDEARRQARAVELAQALNDPPLTEVYSGKALNVLLTDLVQRQADGASTRPVPLAAAVLAHLNVTTEAGGGDPGLLRNGGKLRWPMAWRGAPLREPSRRLRQSLDALLSEAVTQARKGQVSADVVEAVRDDLEGLQALLLKDVKDLEPSQHVQAKRFLAQVEGAVKVLESGEAGRYLGGSLALDPARIKTVGDLVRFMADNSLVFAPSVSGDEVAYAVLRRALASAAGEGAAMSTAAAGL